MSPTDTQVNRLTIMLRLVALLFLVTACLADPLGRVSRLDGRIVGGTEANILDYPYQLSLRKTGAHSCGASIISSEWALTAAHCVDGSLAATMSFRSNSSLRLVGGTVHDVELKLKHPEFNSTSFDFDIALVKVKNTSLFEFGPGTQMIEMAQQDEETPDGSSATVTGWGTTSFNGVTPFNLHTVEVSLWNSVACENAYSAGPIAITDRMICAGGDGGGFDACQGDEGGPMVVQGVLVGVVSARKTSCGDAAMPGVYAKVASMRQWIDDTMDAN